VYTALSTINGTTLSSM